MRVASILLLATALMGCPIQAPDGTDKTDPPYDGPGTEAWGSEDISCDSDSECLTGESCIDDICQVSRCQAAAYESEAPVGQSLRLYTEREIGVADQEAWSGSYYIDGYSPYNTTASYDNSWDRGSGELLDLAGGYFTVGQPESYIVAIDGEYSIEQVGAASNVSLALDFQPVALASGDTDGDGNHEAIAVSEDGLVAFCRLDKRSCEVAAFDDTNLEIIDASAADIDGDTIDELVLLMDYNGDRYIYIHNRDFELTEQVASYSGQVNDLSIERITAADLNGDFLAEIIALSDGGWFDWLGYGNDLVSIISASTTEEATGTGGTETVGILALDSQYEIDGHTGMKDLEAADTNADNEADIAVVDSNGQVVMLRYQGLAVSERYTEQLSVTTSPHRISFADYDGDSPTTRLVEGPIKCDGAPVPLMVLIPPPYDANYSDGVGSAFYGDSDQTIETYEDTVSLGLNVDVGVGASFFDLFSAEVSQKLSWKMDYGTSTTHFRFVGGRYQVQANPELYGPHHGGVTLAWGCFNAYVYELDDPSNILGGDGDGEQFVMTVPVDGAITILSTNRYNAMAEAVGNLPIIDVPYTIGEVESYPQEPETLAGTAIAEENLVFPDEQWYMVSDIGNVTGWRNMTQRDSERWRMSMEMGVSASVAAAGIKVGTGTSIGWGTGYTLTLGQGATFTFTIPPISDDPDTPEDEWAVHKYSVNPIVYLQDYIDAEGTQAYYYVETFTVTK